MVFKKGHVSYWKGKHLSEEHKERLSKSHIKGIKEGKIIPWNKGKKGIYSKETLRKMSLSKKGMPSWNKGKPFSEESKRKMSKSSKNQKPSFGMLNKYHTEKSKEKMSIANSGEKNPSWLGGKSFEPYNKFFNNKFKRAIRKRDNYICMLCKTHQEKLNRTLNVHHINYDKLLSIPQNCCALCVRCNSIVNFNRKNWVKFFQSLLAEKYNYQYNEMKEVIIKSHGS